jgi:hypothetical protein
MKSDELIEWAGDTIFSIATYPYCLYARIASVIIRAFLALPTLALCILLFVTMMALAAPVVFLVLLIMFIIEMIINPEQ